MKKPSSFAGNSIFILCSGWQLFLPLPKATASGCESYTAQFYSFQGTLNTARQSHTYARFTRFIDGKAIERVDISWLPAPGHFRSANRMPLLAVVPGKNYSVEDTKAIAGNKRIYDNGTYGISQRLYLAAVSRWRELNSGRFSYHMLGGELTPNCIQAVSGILENYSTGILRGSAATEQVVSFFLASRQMGSQWNYQNVCQIGD